MLLFALHVITGCIHNVIAWRYYPFHGDVWHYYENALDMTRELHSDMHGFLYDISNINTFTHNSLSLVHMFLNLFSAQNIYINTLLFSFVVFLGTTALFRIFRRHFPESPLAAFCFYLLPSALFYTSCIHREGAVYMLLGFFLYGLENRRNLVLTCCWFLLIVYFRFVVALVVLPALFAAWWPSIPSARRVRGSIALAAVLLLTSPLIVPPALKVLAHYQQAFQALEGHSRIYLPVLDGSLGSLLHALPTGLFNGWLQPLPGIGGQKIYLVFSIELLTIWTIVVFAAIRHFAVPPAPPRSGASPPWPTASALSPTSPAPRLTLETHFSMACILFALASMLLVGLIVPFVGAIVRYRSIYLPFLLAPFLHLLSSHRPVRYVNQWLINHVLIN